MKNIGDKAPEVLGINEKGEDISIRKTAHRAARHRHAVCATTIPNCVKPVTK